MKYSPHIIVGETPHDAIEAEWRDLFNQAESPNPFLSTEWVFTWLRHAGPQVFPITLIIRDENERLVAVWPFFDGIRNTIKDARHNMVKVLCFTVHAVEHAFRFLQGQGGAVKGFAVTVCTSPPCSVPICRRAELSSPRGCVRLWGPRRRGDASSVPTHLRTATPTGVVPRMFQLEWAAYRSTWCRRR